MTGASAPGVADGDYQIYEVPADFEISLDGRGIKSIADLLIVHADKAAEWRPGARDTLQTLLDEHLQRVAPQISLSLGKVPSGMKLADLRPQLIAAGILSYARATTYSPVSMSCL